MKSKVTTIWKAVITSGILMAMLFGLVKTDRARAAINPLLKFEGKVTNVDGSEVADGVYNFSFGLYASSTGGTALWSETLNVTNSFSATVSGTPVGSVITYTGGANTSTLRAGQYLTDGTRTSLIVDFDTAANTITIADTATAWTGTINNRPYVEGGVIDVNLGTAQPLTSVDFYQPLYLEVIFNGETMSPRKLLQAQPYAFEAAKVGGKSASDIPGLNLNETVTGSWTFASTTNITATTSATLLTITQNGTGNIVEFKQGATTTFAISGTTGRVQIGEYIFPYYHGSAGQALMTDAGGNLYWGTPTGAGTVNSGSAGQITYYDGNGNILSGSDLIVLSTSTQRVGIGTTSPDVLLHIGSSTPSHVSGYRDTFLSGSLEINDLFYVNGSGTSTIAGSLDITSGLRIGNNMYVNNAGVVTGGTWQGGTIGMAYGGTGATSFTSGSIVFSNGSALTQDNSNLYWNSANTWLGVGTSSVLGLNVNDRLVVGGDIRFSGNLVSLASSSIGTASNRMANGYFDSLDVLNMSVGGTTISGSESTVFTINSDNSTADTEDSTLAFERGSVTPNATLIWNSTSDRFELNYPLYIYNSSGSGPSNLIVRAGSGQGSDPLLQWQDSSGAVLGMINPSGYLGIGTSTVNSLLTVGSTTGSQFLVNSSGVVTQGVWNGSVLSVGYGGTGTTTFAANSILYASAANTIGEILSSTTPGLILQLDTSGKPIWVATTTLGIDFNNIAGTLSTTQGGTGWDSHLATGFAYINNGAWSASNTISVVNGGTGTTTFETGSLVYAKARNILGEILAGADEYILQMQGGVPTWVSTSTLAISAGDLTGILPVLNGGTGSSTLSGILKGDGINAIVSALLGTDYINNGYLSADAHLTYSNGLISVDGSYNIPLIASTTDWNTFYHTPSTRITAGTGLSWSDNTLNATVYVNQGNLGQIGYYAGNATSTLTATSTIFVDASGKVGISSTSPMTTLSVGGNLTVASGSSLCFGGNCISSWGGAGLGGTVTSVGMTVPTGLTISGSPVTTSGTLALGLDSGYIIPLSASTTDWNTFYHTPSTRITAGTGLSWSDNTLNATVYVNQGNLGQIGYYAGNATSTLTATSSIYIAANGYIGIGTTSMLARLDINGNLLLEGADRYISFNAGNEDATSTYGFRDYNGTMQYKNSGGEWVNIGSAGSSGALGSMSDVSISSAQYGDLIMYNGTSWTNRATATLGLLASSTISSLTTNYLSKWDGSRFANSVLYDDGTHAMIGTSTSNNALTVMSSSGNAQLRLSYDADNYAEFYVNSSGELTISQSSSAYTTIGYGDEALRILPDGRVGIGTILPDATLSIQGIPSGIPFNVSSSTGDKLFTILGNGNVGIGTTTPIDKLSVSGDIGIHNQNGLKLYELETNGFNYIMHKATSTLADNTTYYWPADSTAGRALMTDGNGQLYWGNPEGSGVINSGTTGYISYYAADGNALSATSSIFIATNGYVGIGSTSPMTNFAVTGTSTVSGGYCIGSSCISSWSQAGGVGGSGVSGIAYWSSSNVLGATTSLATNYGGIGQDSTAWSGMVHVVGGTWSNVTGTANTLAYWSDANTVSATSSLYISPTGQLGIGTSSALALLDVNGNLLLEGTDRYISFNSGNTDATSTYGFRDYNGTMQYKNANGQWISIVSSLNSMSDVSITSAAYGDVLMYNGTNWIDMATGSLGIDFSSVGGTAGTGQGGIGEDSSTWNGIVNVVGGNWGVTTGTANTLAYWSDANTVSATSSLYISPTGQLGIGTSSALALLDVNGNLLLEGTDRYISFNSGNTDATSTYGFRDYNGTMQFKNASGQWVAIGSAGSTGALGSLSGVAISNAVEGSAFIYDGTNWVNTEYTPFALMGTSTAEAAAFSNYLLTWNGTSFATSSLYYDGTKTSFYANGVESMVLDVNGNLAIGTSTSAANTKLTVLSAEGAQLRLANTADAYADFTVSPTGMLTIQTSAATSSSIAIGEGTAKDASLILNGEYGAVQQYVQLAWDHLDNKFKIGYSETIGSSTFFTIDSSGKVGVGTTSPSVLFHVGSSTPTTVAGYNDAFISGALEIGGLFYVAGSGTSTISGNLDIAGGLAVGTGLYINSDGTIASGTWNGATISVAYGGTGITSITKGYTLYASADNTLAATSTIYISDAGYVGIGTTTPSQRLSVDGNVYISGNITSGTWNGAAVGVTYGGTGLTSITKGYTLFASADNTLTATSSLYISDSGYIGIGTTTPSGNLDVFGNAMILGDLRFTEDTGINYIQSGDNRTAGSWQPLHFGKYGSTETYLAIGSTGNVGIGSTTPNAKLSIYDGSVTGGADVIYVATSTTGGAIFRVDSYGSVYGDGAAYNTGADYAEYFYTTDADLSSGEVMCMDVAENNKVKRCDRASDSNVMGIVSTKPAVVGNYKDEYANNNDYVIVGLIGQIPAKVTTENGPIRPGDALTSASSTPGYAMRANPGDTTVGVALERLDGDAENVQTGTVNVLIARQNKSLTVEMVEAQVTQRIADMEIEDEVRMMLEQAIEEYDFDDRVVTIVNEQIASFDEALTVKLDVTNSLLFKTASSVDSVSISLGLLAGGVGDLDNRLGIIENWKEGELFNKLAEANQVMTITEEGNIRVGDLTDYSTSTPDVAVFDLETSSTTNKTALVINQRGAGDVADFQASGVSIVNIADTGRVTIVGELLVDGRIMICSGGACGSSLDNAVDETMGDMGVEGTVVAGAFASYCEDGYIWVPGSSKYGTMPGFCVEADLAKIQNSNEVWSNIAQGEAQLTCQGRGDGYHLITENEWLTIAENIIRVSANDISPEVGLQLATSTEQMGTSTITYTLSNGNLIYNLVGSVAQWTDQTVVKSGLVEPVKSDWQEYFEVTDYKGLNIAPPYYYNSDNGIGKIKTGDGNIIMAGFVRGTNGIYSLDLSNSPTTASAQIGFRCSK